MVTEPSVREMTHLPSYDQADPVENATDRFALLYIIAGDTEIQPVHSTTAKLHNRDEYCHASISAEMAKMVYRQLSAGQQHFFLTALAEGLVAFAANDFGAWRRIVDLVGVTDGQRMIDDCEADLARARMLTDYSGRDQLCQQTGVADRIDFAWSRQRPGRVDGAETESGEKT
jgi:hypothetical protein